MSFVTAGHENSQEIRIYYEDHGSGPPLLLIHGYPFSGRAWEREEARFLDEGYRVITYDRRGFGHSDRPAAGYDYDTFASDLNVLVTELGIVDVTLVGHSMGTGEIARYLSAYGADKIRAAVFIAPIPPFLPKTADHPRGVAPEVFDGFKKAIVDDRYAFVTEFLRNFYNTEHFLGKPISPEKLRADFSLAAAASPIAFLKCVDTWLTDFRGDLDKIDVPALVIHGDTDKILPYEITGRPLARALKARELVIPGGAHGISWTHAEVICNEILDFLSGIAPGARPGRAASDETGLSLQ
jgi:non-heme chloroperoxidase